MESYRAGKLGQAALDLEELVEKYPADSLVPSARFWIGEAYFRTGAYRRAATEYEQAIALAPSGEQAPDALYRLGLAYRALKREDRARETWARLLRDHPGSGAAQKARRALDDPERAGAPKPADPGN
jgi:tol-pal system protein YbgF